MNLLFKISYGLFVLCAKAGKEESGCIINTFSQQTSMPETFSVTEFFARSGRAKRRMRRCDSFDGNGF